MEWSGEGLILSVRPHGERDAIVSLLTDRYGRHAGLVPGGASRRKQGLLQPGNRVHARWKARLPEQLGQYHLELMQCFGADFLCRPAPLAGLSSLCALCEALLPERLPQPALYAACLVLLEHLHLESWSSLYVHWELALLQALGFGLDLGQCAAGGANDQLAYVSPRSGRAVSLSAGEPYAARLLVLPDFLVRGGAGDQRAVAQGLALTGHFLTRHAAPVLPAARERLLHRLGGSARLSASLPAP